MGYKMPQLCSSSRALQGQYTHKMFYYIKKKKLTPFNQRYAASSAPVLEWRSRENIRRDMLIKTHHSPQFAYPSKYN